MKVFIGQTDFE